MELNINWDKHTKVLKEFDDMVKQNGWQTVSSAWRIFQDVYHMKQAEEEKRMYMERNQPLGTPMHDTVGNN